MIIIAGPLSFSIIAILVSSLVTGDCCDAHFLDYSICWKRIILFGFLRLYLDICGVSLEIEDLWRDSVCSHVEPKIAHNVRRMLNSRQLSRMEYFDVVFAYAYQKQERQIGNFETVNTQNVLVWMLSLILMNNKCILVECCALVFPGTGTVPAI